MKIFLLFFSAFVLSLKSQASHDPYCSLRVLKLAAADINVTVVKGAQGISVKTKHDVNYGYKVDALDNFITFSDITSPKSFELEFSQKSGQRLASMYVWPQKYLGALMLQTEIRMYEQSGEISTRVIGNVDFDALWMMYSIYRDGKLPAPDQPIASFNFGCTK